MTPTIFNTLDCAERLEEAGIPREHARAHAAVLADMVLAELATKADLDHVAADLRRDLEVLRAAVRHDTDAIRAEFRHDLTAARADLENKIDRLPDRITIRLGALIAVAVTVLAALQKLI